VWHITKKFLYLDLFDQAVFLSLLGFASLYARHFRLQYMLIHSLADYLFYPWDCRLHHDNEDSYGDDEVDGLAVEAMALEFASRGVYN
jgi:hypothetical protein